MGAKCCHEDCETDVPGAMDVVENSKALKLEDGHDECLEIGLRAGLCEKQTIDDGLSPKESTADPAQAEDPSKSQELTVEELQGEHFEADVGVESHSVRPEPTARYISDAVSGLGVTESATTANWVILEPVAGGENQEKRMPRSMTLLSDSMPVQPEEMHELELVYIELQKKGPQDFLGIFVRNIHARGVVQVMQVQDSGAVIHANNTNAKQGKPALKELDIILNVNGVQGSCAEILEECKRQAHLSLKVLRPSDAPADSGDPSKWHLDWWTNSGDW